MECVDGESPSPPELRLSWSCERYHSLPDAGGYLDQDWALMLRMNALANIYGAYSRYRNAQGRQIHSLTIGERQILRMLKDKGILFNA